MGSDPHVDAPGSPWDLAVTGIIGLACILLVAGNAIMLLNRKYRPIKTKSVGLTALSSCGGLIWIAATIVGNDHLGRRKDTLWSICWLWVFWLRVCFGISLWLNCMNVRLIILYNIFIRKRGPVKKTGAKRFRFSMLALLLLHLPVIIFCLAASVKHVSRFEVDQLPSLSGNPSSIRSAGKCHITLELWNYSLLSMLLAYFVIFLALAFKLRNAMAQFNEFRLIWIGGIMSLFLLLLSLVNFQTYAYTQVIGRGFSSLSVAAAVSYYFWARNYAVVYNVLFHRENYARKFNEEMNCRPSEHEWDSYPASFWNLAIELKQTQDLMNDYQRQIKELQEEIYSMEMKFSRLQQQVELCSIPSSQ